MRTKSAPPWEEPAPFMAPLGFKGTHPKICECAKCLAAKIKLFKERIRLMNKPAFPPTQDSTVPVRAHWRRQPNHLRKQPLLRRWVAGEVKALRHEAEIVETRMIR
jgi:hypothetical protein